MPTLKNFIVIEGIDGAGKTTLCHSLAQWLESRGIPSLYVSNPSDSAIGKHVKSWLAVPNEICAKSVFHLFAAAQWDLLAQTIIPAIKAGKVVVCDRYTLSTVAYQLQFADAFPTHTPWILGKKTIIGPEYLGVLAAYPHPEHQIVLTLPWGVAKSRKDKLDAWESSDVRMNRVATFYRDQYHPEVGPKTEVDATTAGADVFARVKHYLASAWRADERFHVLWENPHSISEEMFSLHQVGVIKSINHDKKTITVVWQNYLVDDKPMVEIIHHSQLSSLPRVQYEIGHRFECVTTRLVEDKRLLSVAHMKRITQPGTPTRSVPIVENN